MKRKEYKVKIKLIYETSYIHSDTSMEKAKKYFERAFKMCIDGDGDIRDFFDKDKPILKYRVEKNVRRTKN